jgi:adenine-specific DNA-methyltransferase
MAHIGNGLVSGLDKAFKVPDGRKLSRKEKSKVIPVIKAKNLRKYYVESFTPYIFVNDVETEDELKSNYPNIFSQLMEHKPQLTRRYQYEGNIPWWHWVFLRNFNLIANNIEKIVVPCKERIDKKGYVRFSLAEGKFYVTQDATAIVMKEEFREDIRYLLALLNSDVILNWLKYKGLRRGGVLEFSERPLASIPIRLIDWENEHEVRTHNTIVQLVNQIIQNKKLEPYMQKIASLIKELYFIEPR